jgi:hypothetical protein
MISRKTLFITVLSVGCSLASAHPGTGIVMDRKGSVYYTDLKHVWKLMTDGKKIIVVRNVHTHELYMDPQDNLYGEHLWYEGDATKRWGHRVWRLSSDGKLVDIIPAREGFLDDYDDFHFVHDGTGASYWAARGDVTAIRKRTANGKVTTIASARFQNVRWMTATADRIVYLTDLHDLVRITPDGTVRVVVKNLADRRRSFLLTVDTHAIMGLWVGREGSIYAAVPSDNAVKRMHPDGTVEIVARSPAGWKPSGGLAAPSGDLWILEYSFTNAVRVRRIRAEEITTIFE